MSVTISSPVVVGSPAAITVTADDPFGNVETGCTDTVSFSSTDGQASLPAAYKFTTGSPTGGTTFDNGQHTFYVTFGTVAPQETVTVTDGSMMKPPARRSARLAASQFSFPTTPATVLPDGTTTVTLTADTQYDNPVSGLPVSFAWYWSSVKGVKGGTATLMPSRTTATGRIRPR